MEEHEIDEIRERRAKYMKKTISIILLVLVVSYVIMYPYGFRVIESLAVSYKIKDNVIDIEDNKIVFDVEIYNELKKIYSENDRNEFRLCLKGKIIRNLYYIDEIFKPDVKFADYNKIISDSCPLDTLIDLHKHPFRDCVFSKQDIKSYEISKQDNSGLLMAVMCDYGRFSFYS